MKRMHYFWGFCAILFVVLYFIDRGVWMKQRVTRHNSWEYETGEKIRGSFIDDTRNVIFKGNTMIFDFDTREQKIIVGKSIAVKVKGDASDLEIIEKLSKNETFQDDRVSFRLDTNIYEHGGRGRRIDTLILKYQYFNTMKVMDPKTKKTGKYSMKGANWIDYFSGKRKKKFK